MWKLGQDYDWKGKYVITKNEFGFNVYDIESDMNVYEDGLSYVVALYRQQKLNWIETLSLEEWHKIFHFMSGDLYRIATE